MVLAIAVLVGIAPQAAAGTETRIGSTVFFHGPDAFPNVVQCLDPTGCGGSVFLLDPQLHPVTARAALLGANLNLVAINVDQTDQFRLSFPVPIRNLYGDDLYLGQAEFLADLAQAVEVNDIEVRFQGSDEWHTIPASAFVRETALAPPTVYYSDPEIKTDAYRLWFAKLNLSDFGFQANAQIASLDVRGVAAAGSATDIVVIGNLNSCETGDVNGDGVMDITDVAILRRILSGVRVD
jgi:hypothetical protein